MAKTKPRRKAVDSVTIPGTEKIVRVGDNVLLRPLDTTVPPYVALVTRIEKDKKNHVKVLVRWYYKPEDSKGGRRQFHGAKELFLSDHYDVQIPYAILGTCVVHSFMNYTMLDNVTAEDYYCRFHYNAVTGVFTPDRVSVYCECEMPYNPDILMVRCEKCKDWYHPMCMGLTVEEAMKLERFECPECLSGDELTEPLAKLFASSGADGKKGRKRQKTGP